MSKDGSKQSPMFAQAGAGTDTTTATTSDSASATDRAQAMRARLGVQRDAEEMLAEASQLRRSAAQDADAMVADAEALATQLVEEARETAEKVATEAQERAAGILARARYEAEDLQRHTEEERARIREEVLATGRAEIEAFRARSSGLIDDAHHGLQQVAPALEGAVSTVLEVLRSLEMLRDGGSDVEPGPRPTAPPAAIEASGRPEAAPVPDAAADSGEAMVAEGAPATNRDDPDARPLGWLFRASQA